MLRAFANGTLFGEDFGSDSPWLLALHGWGRSHVDFAPLWTATGESSLDAIALDLPGFGAAPVPGEPWGTEDFAEAIRPVLGEMTSRVVVLGHSFGGLVATQLATLAPDRVSALVLTGAPLLGPTTTRARPSWRYRAVRFGARVGLVSSSSLDAARQRHGSADYRAAEGVMRDILVRDLSSRAAGAYEPLLRSLDLPVELVWGELDTAAPLAMAKRVAEMLSNPRLDVLAGVDHFTPTHAPDALRAAALRHRP